MTYIKRKITVPVKTENGAIVEYDRQQIISNWSQLSKVEKYWSMQSFDVFEKAIKEWDSLSDYSKSLMCMHQVIPESVIRDLWKDLSETHKHHVCAYQNISGFIIEIWDSLSQELKRVSIQCQNISKFIIEIWDSLDNLLKEEFIQTARRKQGISWPQMPSIMLEKQLKI